MANIYTDHHIIRFIYKECDLFEKIEMEVAMEEDSTLLETYETLVSSYQVLPRLLFSPKKNNINAILAYSRMA